MIMAEVSGSSSAGGETKKERPIQIKEFGLTQIDEKPEGHQYVADVVFVHGLQGHPQTTWQSKANTKSSRRPRKRLKLLSWIETDEMAHKDVQPFWPADILAHDFEDVRILTFGYDSKVTREFAAPSSKNGIFQHGNSFLRAVGRARVGCRQRPIVFVAHSLGGLIVKQALIEARKQTHDSDLLDIHDSTHAVIFFGTPHRGADLASWGLLLSNIAEAVQLDTNNAVLRDLDPTSGSSKLEEMRLDFDDIVQDNRRSRELRIYSFQEEEGMTGLKVFGKKVVPDHSSSFDSRKHGSDTIHANHMNMCRLNGKDDDGYEKFSGVLEKYIGQIRTEKNEANKVRRENLLNSLHFAERQSREHQLRNCDAREETFQWIWSSSSFVEWLSSQDGVYWISGKPGSGKSVLVEHLVRHDRTMLELQTHHRVSWIILHFFFDFRGGKQINNSFEGLLKSLLRQLIQAIPQLDILEIGTGGHESISDWPEYRLRDALRRSLENVNKGVCIFVDGLDEYEGSVTQLFGFLMGLTTNQKFSTKICVSSRPDPILAQLLQHLPNLSLSDHNESGIRSYCLRTLEGLDTAVHSDLNILGLSRIIADRAEGVFLWARFALEEVIKGHCNGEETGELLGRLEKIPQEIEEVYDLMLAHLEPSAKEECMVMLQLVCFAKRPLLWQELSVAIRFAMKTDLAVVERIGDDNDSAEASKEYKTFSKRLRAKAVGLLELYKVGAPPSIIRPKLIHKSVQAYLNQKGWVTLGGLKGNNLVRHESMYVETCIRYLRSLLRHVELENNPSQNTLQSWLHRTGLSDRRSDGILPFFSYATFNVLSHASSLEQEGQSSHALLHKFLTKQVVDLHGSERCRSCLLVPTDLWFKEFDPISKAWFEAFDPIYVAFAHGLVSYCKDDLRVRSPPPTQSFWEQALDITLSAVLETIYVVQEMMSLVLPNLTTIRQYHLERATLGVFGDKFLRLELLLEHPSVQELQLVDNEGQNVTLLWLYAQELCDYDEGVLNLLIDRAKRRGETARQRCGPKGNLVETLLEQQSPDVTRGVKLILLRKHYESMSWPFEYDLNEEELRFSYIHLSGDQELCAECLICNSLTI